MRPHPTRAIGASLQGRPRVGRHCFRARNIALIATLLVRQGVLPTLTRMKHDTQRPELPAFSSPGSDASPQEAQTHRSSVAGTDLHLESELPTTWDDWKSVRDLG